MAVGLTVDIASNAKELSRGFRRADRDIEMFGKQVSGKLAKAFRLGGLGLTAGFAAGTAGITKLIGDIDAASKTLVSTTGATGDALKGLEADVRLVARSVPQGTVEISGMVGALNNLFGVSGVAGQEMAKLALDFNRLAGVEGTDSISKIASAMKLFGVESEGLDDTLGDIIKASQEFNVGIGALTAGLEQYAGTFVALGFNMDETIALMGQFQRAGVPISKVGEGLAQFIPNVLKAGGDVRTEFTRWVDLFAMGEQGVYDFNEAVKLFGAESINALIEAAPNLDLGFVLGDNAGLVTDLGEEVLGVGDRFAIVGNQIETAFIPLVESMIPTIEGLADATAEFVETWTDEGLTAAINDARAALDGFLDSKGVGDSGLSELIKELWSFADAVDDIKDELLGFAAEVAGVVPGLDGGDPGERSGTDRALGVVADLIGAAEFAFIDLPDDALFQLGFGIRQHLAKTGVFGTNDYIWQDLQHVTDSLATRERALALMEEAARGRRQRAQPVPAQLDFGGSIAQPLWEAAGILQTPADNLSDSAADLSQAADELKPFDPDTDPALTAAEVAERYLAGAREGATPGGLQDALVEWMGRQEDFAEGFSQDLENALDDHAQAVEDAAEIARKAGEEFDPDDIKFDFEEFIAELDSYWTSQFPGLDLSDDARRMLLQDGLDLDDAQLIASLNALTTAVGGFVPEFGAGDGGGVVVVGGGAPDPGQRAAQQGLGGFRTALISAGIDPVTGRPRTTGLPGGLPQGEGEFTARDEFNLARFGGFFDSQGAFVDVSGAGRTFGEARAGLPAGGAVSVGASDPATRTAIQETAQIAQAVERQGRQAQRAAAQASAAAETAVEAVEAATSGGYYYDPIDEAGNLPPTAGTLQLEDLFDPDAAFGEGPGFAIRRQWEAGVPGGTYGQNPLQSAATNFNLVLPEGTDPLAAFNAQQRAMQTGLSGQTGFDPGNR